MNTLRTIVAAVCVAVAAMTQPLQAQWSVKTVRGATGAVSEDASGAIGGMAHLSVKCSGSVDVVSLRASIYPGSCDRGRGARPGGRPQPGGGGRNDSANIMPNYGKAPSGALRYGGTGQEFTPERRAPEWCVETTIPDRARTCKDRRPRRGSAGAAGGSPTRAASSWCGSRGTRWGWAAGSTAGRGRSPAATGRR